MIVANRQYDFSWTIGQWWTVVVSGAREDDSTCSVFFSIRIKTLFVCVCEAGVRGGRAGAAPPVENYLVRGSGLPGGEEGGWPSLGRTQGFKSSEANIKQCLSAYTNIPEQMSCIMAYRSSPNVLFKTDRQEKVSS